MVDPRTFHDPIDARRVASVLASEALA